MKEMYEVPVLQIAAFATEDVIRTSFAGSDNETSGDDL